MESTGGGSGPNTTAAAVSAAMPSPSNVADSSKATNYDFDPSISEEEKRFYLKAYPTVDVVRERKTHCTVCKVHIGTAPVQENGIKMHPILRVTHCNKCHDFYNSGEFSKGEDGSELYCRWCGQGGEVYCCSSCPYVFCKSCIVKNLSRGVVADIEQNENWNCFSCAPKILWPLRAQHWALMNYIEQQKKELYTLNLSETELKQNLAKDRSKCCRLAKAKCGNMSDSMESLDSIASKRSHGSTNSAKKPIKHSATPSPQQMNAAKRAKTNDEVVCTPDLLSMLEPDCQITVSPKPNRPMTTPSASAPKIMSIQQPQSGYNSVSSINKNSAPPPLVLRNTAIKLRPAAPPPVVRRTIIGPRTPNPGGNGAPVYHTINGYRIDLNSAAQQETFRLPNGKLIQVKRQGPATPQNTSPSPNNWQQINTPQPQRVIPQTIASRPVQITQHPYNITVQQQQPQTQHPQVVRYHNNMIGSTTINPVNHNGTSLQVLNGQISSTVQPPPPQQQQPQSTGPIRPVMVRHVFPDNPIGQARSGLQDQVFNAMEICTHLTNKVQTLTNSNAYKQARNFLEVKELYIHLSYLLTYAIGRFKSLQDKCLGDMRNLGFGSDADCLENGQLAADKQASDDEDNEIEIVEPKTDLITLDSDDDEGPVSSPSKSQQTGLNKTQQQTNSSSQQVTADAITQDGNTSASVAHSSGSDISKPAPPSASTPQEDENMDLMSMAQSFLASMLEVDINEGPLNSSSSDSSGQKKQPRKKLTSKPNPTLLKQKALMERERLEEMKRNDQKLKMKCAVELNKAEEMFPCAKEMLEAQAKEKHEHEEALKNKGEKQETEDQVKLVVETDKETVEVEFVIDDDDVTNSSTKRNNNLEKNDLLQESCEELNEYKGASPDSPKEVIEEVNKINDKQIKENETATKSNERNTSLEDVDEEESVKNQQNTNKESHEVNKNDETNSKEIDSEKEKDIDCGKVQNNVTKTITKPIEQIKNKNTEKNKMNSLDSPDNSNKEMEIDSQTQSNTITIETERKSPQRIDSLGTDAIETDIIGDDEELDVEKEIEKVLQQQHDRKDIYVSVEITNRCEQLSTTHETILCSKNEAEKQTVVNESLQQSDKQSDKQSVDLPSMEKPLITTTSAPVTTSANSNV